MTFNDSLFTTNLWDLADYTNGRPTKPSELVKQGIPIIKIAELSRGITAQTNMVSRQVVDPKHIVREGDLLFAWSGTIGIHTYNGPEAALNQHIFKVVAKDFIDQAYLRYLLEEQLKVLQGFVEEKKTTMGHVTIANLKTVEVSIPTDLNKQRRIASHIESIDDLLNVEREKGKTLEAIAKTIFKSWFIDFDPVKAKMAGEKPAGMDAATAALFPDSMEESELGLIPKGWGVKVISDFGKVVTGKTPSTKVPEYWGENIPFVTIPDMHGQLLVTSTARALSQEGANSQRSQNIPAGSTMVTCIATPGLVGYATKNCQTNQQINSVIPNFEQSSIWLYWHLRGLIPTLIRNSGIGTVFANLNKSDFSNIKSITPDMPLRDAFSQIIEPIMELLTTTNYKSQYLRDIRDTLLPRLISGELQIPEEMLAS